LVSSWASSTAGFKLGFFDGFMLGFKLGFFDGFMLGCKLGFFDGVMLGFKRNKILYYSTV
jgi:hypothetical protein